MTGGLAFSQENGVDNGFERTWVYFITKCLSIVSYSVVLNGKHGSTFRALRGLRQEDPLNPYLFLICSEGLSSLIRKVIDQNFAIGTKISKADPNFYS